MLNTYPKQGQIFFGWSHARMNSTYPNRAWFNVVCLAPLKRRWNTHNNMKTTTKIHRKAKAVLLINAAQLFTVLAMFWQQLLDVCHRNFGSRTSKTLGWCRAIWKQTMSPCARYRTLKRGPRVLLCSLLLRHNVAIMNHIHLSNQVLINFYWFVWVSHVIASASDRVAVLCCLSH